MTLERRHVGSMPSPKTLELVRQDKLNWHTYRATARIGHKINTFGRKVQTSTTSDSHQTKWNDDKTKEMQITDFAPQYAQPSLRATLNRRRSCNSAYKKWKTFTIVVVLHRRHYWVTWNNPQKYCSTRTARIQRQTVTLQGTRWRYAQLVW